MNTRSTTLFHKIDLWEWRLCQAFNQFAHIHFILHSMRLVSRLGDGLFWYGLMLAMPLLYGWHGFSITLKMALIGLGCTLIYKGLKQTLGRQRPYLSCRQINCQLPPLDYYSFPSGHTLHAVAFCTLVAAYAPELWLLTSIFTCLVALSRVVLGLHYPSDVLAGAVLGYTLASVSLLLFPL